MKLPDRRPTQGRKLAKTLAAATFLAALAAAGCEADDGDQATFGPADQMRLGEALYQRQADLGARRDATLHPVHFDGPILNSLGEDVLDRIARAPRGGPIDVYLDLPQDHAMTNARRADVEAFFDKLAVPAQRLTVTVGPSPDTSPAAPALGGYAGDGSGAAPAGESISLAPITQISGSSAK